ncbi:MAG: precorrin-6A/cobalt-precorrin-6A reductase, partial [Clostridiales bacterium]|nr:precorrin-6A/cobalt-precorrin-6A reductase [Clostridiales bacterium]
MKDRQILIFAGTREGRELAEFLTEQRIPALVCVATDYGEELLQPNAYVHARKGRMDETEMEELLREMRPPAVIDATHPYAALVTENIQRACEQEHISYY